MNMEQLSCPACSAPIAIAPNESQAKCSFCGVTLRVKHSGNDATLLVAEQITSAISDSHAQTQAAIAENTAVTRDELRRMQLSQELSNIELRVSNLQSEARILQRLPANKVNKRQLQELRSQEAALLTRKAEIEAILYPELSANAPTNNGSANGCLGTFLLILAWIFLFPFMLAWKLLRSESRFLRTGGIVLVVITLAFLIHSLQFGFPDNQDNGRPTATTLVVLRTSIESDTLAPPITTRQPSTPTPQQTPTTSAASPQENPTPTEQATEIPTLVPPAATLQVAVGVLQPAPAPASPEVTTNSSINIRSGPGTAYDIVGTAEGGATFKVTGKNEENTWWQIDFNGQPAWVFGELVTATVAEAVAPVNAVQSLSAIDQEQPGIPGLSPSSLINNLTGAGVECTGPKEYENVGRTWYSWECLVTEDTGTIVTKLHSRQLTTVDFLEVTVLQYDTPSAELVAELLTVVPWSIFSLYGERAQSEAVAWVEATLPLLTGQAIDVHETTINGVKMRLSGPQAARTLEIGSRD